LVFESHGREGKCLPMPLVEVWFEPPQQVPASASCASVLSSRAARSQGAPMRLSCPGSAHAPTRASHPSWKHFGLQENRCERWHSHHRACMLTLAYVHSCIPARTRHTHGKHRVCSCARAASCRSLAMTHCQ